MKVLYANKETITVKLTLADRKANPLNPGALILQRLGASPAIHCITGLSLETVEPGGPTVLCRSEPKGVYVLAGWRFPWEAPTGLYSMRSLFHWDDSWGEYPAVGTVARHPMEPDAKLFQKGSNDGATLPTA